MAHNIYYMLCEHIFVFKPVLNNPYKTHVIESVYNEWNTIIDKWSKELKEQKEKQQFNWNIRIIDRDHPGYVLGQVGYVIQIDDVKYTDRLNFFLSNKVNLADCAGNLDIFPETSIVTHDDIFVGDKYNTSKKWILKLEDGSSAKDVYIINTKEDFNIMKDVKKANKRWVLQEYICNPMLLFGKYKFHLRSHTIILNGKAYVFNSCDVLAATNVYNKEDFTDVKSHITNVAINKSSENHKTYISNEFPEIHCLMPEVYKLIEKSLVLPNKEYNKVRYDGWNIFALLAHDILVDENGRLYLLEINSGPGMYKLNQMTEIYEANIKKFISGMFRIFIDGKDESFNILEKELPEDYAKYMAY